MENMDLNNAEVAVTTQHILDGKEYKDYWVQMSDYSDMGEFLCACSDLFPEEEDPEYRYAKWENIPDRLINREWICPNFFEIRDAMERLDENEREYFVTWSEHFGYDITTDDPHMMVSHYQDIYGNTIQENKGYMEISFKGPVMPIDPYSQLAFVEILNIILIAKHIMDVNRYLIARNVNPQFGSLSGYFRWSFANDRFTLWQRTDYNSDMCFSHRILDMPFCMLAAKDKENDERVFN